LSGKATALAYGAATVVNAIALGKGAAFGVNLWTKAEVELTNEPNVITVNIVSDPKESTLLVEKTVQIVLNKFGLANCFGARVKTESNIPAARGLKSSSVAANATALSTVAALGKKLDDLEIIRIGVEAAFKAKVTVTGAFDDACASFFGGAVITDNLNQKIIRQQKLPDDLLVMFHVPHQKEYTINSDVERLKTVKPLVELAFELALKGNLWDALTLNGLVYSAASNMNSKIAIDALAAGAVAAGLCGKGPAVAVVTSNYYVDKVRASLQKYEGEIITAHFNSEKAKVL